MPVLETATVVAGEAAAIAVEVGEAVAEVAEEVAATAVEAGEKVAEVTEEVAATTAEIGEKAAEVTVEEAKEITAKDIETTDKTKDVVVEKLRDIKSMSPEQLREQMEIILSEINTDTSIKTNEGTETKEGLTDEQKQRIKEEAGWSDEIIDSIDSWEEYDIYKNAGLTEAAISDKECLIRNDIGWNQKDAFGRTNKERAEQGLSPLNKDGKPIELHHIGQHADSPLAELTQKEHRGKGNDGILHNKKIESETHGEGNKWASEKNNYWKDRINTKEGGESL